MTEKKVSDLTEMEGLALGLIKMMQPASAYALAAAFAKSPSAFWSGSAGAIYPLVQRLEKAGLLHGEPSKTGKRKSRLYSLSKEGEAAFQVWLLDAERAVNPGFDPLRSRLSMLHLTTSKRRESFIGEVEVLMKEHKATPLPEEETSERFQSLHDSWLQYRLNWMKAIRKLFSGF